MEKTSITSAFDPHYGEWQINWPERVSRHDLVYLSPPEDPMQGLALGNGDTGVLCWCEGSKLIMAVNKCDLWDDAKFGRFHNWSAEEEEYSTTLRHAGRIIIDFRFPVFDIFYLSDFSGRLSLADATAYLRAVGPFGDVEFTAYVCHDDGMISWSVNSNLKDNPAVEITLERYGSRTFSHWYKLINRDASIGVQGTESFADEDGVYITHKLTSGIFGLGCRVVADDKHVRCSRIHSHAARITLSGDAARSFSALSIVTSPGEVDAVCEIRNTLDEADYCEPPKRYEAHAEAWKFFWMRSFMDCGDDYLDNMWHLYMYYANSSQRGRYPGRFIGGLWGWNRDVQPWNFYFHWNQQQIYWPLNAAGHHELLDSYLDYRFSSLPLATRDADELLHSEGAVVSDVCDRRGYNSVHEFVNHTPVAEIALDFWRQYRFTGDEAFLCEYVAPYMREAAIFFESLFEKGEDGLYHARKGTAYEGWIELRDAVTELAYAQVLFRTAVKALEKAGVDEPHTAKWIEIVENLAPFITTPAGDHFIHEENGVLKYRIGAFAGEEAGTDMIFAAGYGIKEKQILTTWLPSDNEPEPFELIEMIEHAESKGYPKTGSRKGAKINDGIFPAATTAPVFPSGVIGLSTRGEYLFQTAVNTIKLYSPDCMGWDTIPVALARLGLAHELGLILADWPGRWQFYCNGWGHYGPREVMRADAAFRFRIAIMEDAASSLHSQSTGERPEFHFPSWPFRHMGMESMAVLACAINESLLQSHEGMIRVAPAVRDNQNARFTLHAAGGFVVSAEVVDGQVRWVSIRSLRGGTCRVVNPWKAAYMRSGTVEPVLMEGTLIEFAADAGTVYRLTPEQTGICEIESLVFEANENPKFHRSGSAVLGLPRLF